MRDLLITSTMIPKYSSNNVLLSYLVLLLACFGIQALGLKILGRASVPLKTVIRGSNVRTMRLSVSILIDINEEWMTTKRYLSMDAD